MPIWDADVTVWFNLMCHSLLSTHCEVNRVGWLVNGDSSIYLFFPLRSSPNSTYLSLTQPGPVTTVCALWEPREPVGEPAGAGKAFWDPLALFSGGFPSGVAQGGVSAEGLGARGGVGWLEERVRPLLTGEAAAPAAGSLGACGWKKSSR